MGLIAKLKGKVEYTKYLHTLMLSAGLALLTLYIAFGFIYFATGGDLPPSPLILLILAIFFVIFAVFYESSVRGKRKDRRRESLRSLAKGLFLGSCATFAFIALLGGLQLTVRGAIPPLDWIVYAFAICMILNTVFLSLLKPSPVKETP